MMRPNRAMFGATAEDRGGLVEQGCTYAAAEGHPAVQAACQRAFGREARSVLYGMPLDPRRPASIGRNPAYAHGNYDPLGPTKVKSELNLLTIDRASGCLSPAGIMVCTSNASVNLDAFG
jgi:hypothetical protein